LAKLLTEWAFEEILTPEQVGPTSFRLPVPPRGALTFDVVDRHLWHWRVDPSSLEWVPTTSGEVTELPEVTDVVALLAPRLGLQPSVAAGMIAELSSTLLSDTWQLTWGRPAAELADLAETNPLLVEGEMRAHPWLVANKGRVGFDSDDLARYAPEAQQPVRLEWLAAAPEIADQRTARGVDHATVVREQVGDEVWDELQWRAWKAGMPDPATAVYFPVHPWQWRHKILPLHAAQLAKGSLVPLGVQPARYLPQQSVRTMVDIDHPERRYMKLPLSILNTSVYRGLVRDRALAAPGLSDWIVDLADQDPFLKETGLILLGEVASVSVAHPSYETLPGAPYQHTEMLGAIWRESVAGHLDQDEQAVTLAALLHRDPTGVPFLDPVIIRSGVTVADWVDRLHGAVLPPLVHILYRFGMMFSPHAQNCLLVMAGHRPVRLAFKDFADDAVIASEVLPEMGSLPADVRAALGSGVAAAKLPEWLQGGLLLCVYRYLSELFEDQFGYPEAAFWASAARTLEGYHERFRHELADRFALFDLQSPTFAKLCLNRLRLFERGYSDDADRPYISTVGTVPNPLA
jgi:siderophore synthetase component